MSLSIAFSATAVLFYLAIVSVIIGQRGKSRTDRAFVLYLAAMTLWQFTALMVSLSKRAGPGLENHQPAVAPPIVRKTVVHTVPTVENQRRQRARGSDAQFCSSFSVSLQVPR